MLSHGEIEDINRKLRKQPTGKFARSLRKKLTEHEYASTLPPFSPHHHRLVHVNRFTSTETLNEIIAEADKATTFTLDTESVNVYRKKNRPALIQVQIVSTTTIVVILETNHLPPPSSEQFLQIRRWCRIVLDPARTIYVWGKLSELDEFLSFRLFTKEQLVASNSRDLQEEFKEFWHAHGDLLPPHPNSTHSAYVRKNRNESWSLQDAVAALLEEWLDKRHSRSPFDTGLDPAFRHPTAALRERQATLTAYAANDCLAMDKILVAMQEAHTISPTATTDTRRHVTLLITAEADSTTPSSQLDGPPRLVTIESRRNRSADLADQVRRPGPKHSIGYYRILFIPIGSGRNESESSLSESDRNSRVLPTIGSKPKFRSDSDNEDSDSSTGSDR